VVGWRRAASRPLRGWAAAQRLSAAGAAGASQGKRQQRAGKGKQPPAKQPAGAAGAACIDGGSKAGTSSPAGGESAGGETLQRQRPPRGLFPWVQFGS